MYIYDILYIYECDLFFSTVWFSTQQCKWPMVLSFLIRFPRRLRIPPFPFHAVTIANWSSSTSGGLLVSPASPAWEGKFTSLALLVFTFQPSGPPL